MKIPLNKIINNKFGRLTPIKEVDPHICKGGSKMRRFLCRCECGSVKKVLMNHLMVGSSKSCGCIRKENMSTHNMSKTPEYRAYMAILSRCTNPNNENYKHYGGRGIKCLLNSFEEFYEEVGKRPSKKHSIDRIDNNSCYKMGNIRWVLSEVQMNNKRSNHLITHNDQTKTLAQWARELNIEWSTIYSRLYYYGWTIEKALSKV